MTTLQDKLEAAGLKFQVDGILAFGMFETDGNRTHAFSIDLQGEDWGGVHEHDVIFKLGELNNDNDLMLLCSMASRILRGGIAVSDGSIFFKAELPTDLPGDVWVKQIAELAQIADLLEQVLDPNSDNY